MASTAAARLRETCPSPAHGCCSRVKHDCARAIQSRSASEGSADLQDTPSRNLVCIEGSTAFVTSKQRELLFTPGDWDTAQSVELAAFQDRRQESPVHRGSVEHRASSSQDPS